LTRFGLVGHPRDYRHYYDDLKRKVIDIPPYSQPYVEQQLGLAVPFVSDYWNACFSTPDRVVSGLHIVTPITPDSIIRKPKAAIKQIERAIGLAVLSGASVLTLGGLTSVVFRERQLSAAHDYGIAITTGASLTSAVTVKMIERATAGLDVNLTRATLAVVGATGEVGRGCAMALQSRVAKLVLVGRNRTRLERLEDELVDQGGRPGCIFVSTDLEGAVVDADVIITLASTPDLPIPAASLRAGTIVCDVGYPRNIGPQIRGRPDVHVFDGGLVRLPKPLSFSVETSTPGPEVLFGCFAEAIILAIENRLTNYSSGPTSVTTERMDEIYQLATKHGFREACPLSLLQALSHRSGNGVVTSARSARSAS